MRLERPPRRGRLGADSGPWIACPCGRRDAGRRLRCRSSPASGSAEPFSTEPSHTLTAAVALAFRPLDEESRTLTGLPLPDHTLAIAFAANIADANPNAIGFAVRPGAFHCAPAGCGDASHRVAAALRVNSPLPALRTTLEGVDGVLQLLVLSYGSSPAAVDRERFEIVLRGGTPAAREVALAAITAREQDAVNARNAVEHGRQMAERNKRNEQGRIVNGRPLHSIWPEDLAVRGVGGIVQVEDAALWGASHPCPPGAP